MATQPIDNAEPANVADNDAEAASPSPVQTVEDLAMEMGWKPKDQYAGPEERWKPAADFLRAERDVTRGLKKKVDSLGDQIARMVATSDQMTRRALKEQAEAINAKFVGAVEKGDTKTAAAAAKEMNELEASAAPVTSRNFEQDFASRNTWYGKDEDATDYAVTISQREARKGATPEQQLEAVEKGVRKRFPELFEAVPAQQRQAPGVATPNRAAPPKRDPGFGDLPADAKAAAQRHAKLMKEEFGKSEADSLAAYTKTYWANKAAA